MPSLFAAAIATLAGGLVGVILRRGLTAAPYRAQDEIALPSRRSLWLVPATALFGGLAWWATALGRPTLIPLTYLFATWGMVALTFIDLDVHRLPDAIQIPAYPAVLILLSLCSAATGDWTALLRAVLAGAALYAVFLVLVLVAPAGGMGFGDVKLAGLLGLLLGWQSWAHLIVGSLGTFLLGGVVAATLLLTGKAGPQTEFAYGPVMMGSSVATLLLLSPVTLRALI